MAVINSGVKSPEYLAKILLALFTESIVSSFLVYLVSSSGVLK